MLGRVLRHPASALVVIALISYAYFYQAGGWNQNSRFDLVRATVEERSARIDRYHRNTGDKACRGPAGRCVKAQTPEAHYYCDKAPGASWLATPMYAAIYAVAGSERPSPRYLEWAAHLSTVFAVAVPSALSVGALFALLVVLGLSRRASIGLALGYGFATLAFPYSTLFYGHQLTAALALLAFAALVRERRTAFLGRAGLFGVGLVLGMAVVVEYPSALLLVVILAYAVVWMRGRTRWAWLFVGIAIPGLACAGYHWLAFGGPLTLPYEFSTQPHRSQGFFMGLGKPDFGVTGELLFGSYRGLLYSAPWLAAALPGAVLWLRRSEARAEACACLAIVVLFLWLNASLVDWQGGWAMGPRYLVPAIPFLIILSAGLFRPGALDGWANARAARWITTAASALLFVLAARSSYWMLVGTAVKPEVPVHIQKPYSEYLFPQFDRGKLGVSTQSIDMAGAPRTGAKQAWNLGEKVFGLEGRASLLPLWAVQLLGIAWLSWGCRRGAGADATKLAP